MKKIYKNCGYFRKKQVKGRYDRYLYLKYCEKTAIKNYYVYHEDKFKYLTK